MSCLLSKRTCLMVLLSIATAIFFTTIGRKNVLAGSNAEHSFYLPSILKQGTDVYPREIRFFAKYPGVIEADASWEPAERELTITLYDQEGKSLVSKKGPSLFTLFINILKRNLRKPGFWVIHLKLRFHNLLLRL
ncbi:MAG: hypothetical protein SCABRO_01737 [Candidatus Scalindua brodae]|uniref:Uncharacterized protein n=1 Tax=Candidatus Scalindua brodae TaxID=237368 RepID=A0A0B0EKI4_9BACT|nr:MAG: hypothetical protein SCABRO_01737 [Candidatus Scalindua brodae]